MIGLMALVASPACAGWKGTVVGLDEGGRLTVDSAGTTHLVSFTAYHAFDLAYTTYSRLGVRGPQFKSNVGLSYPLALAIATDSKNRPHAAVIDNLPGFVFKLYYLDFNGHGWNSQLVDTALIINSYSRFLQLILDANDHPHLFYVAANGFLAHAFFDGAAWHVVNTGAAVAPTSLRIGADGTIHVAGISITYGQVCEERGLDGSWTGECFDNSDGGDPVLNLAPDGTPEVVYGGTEPPYYDTVRMAHFDGANWSTQTIFDGNAFGVPRFQTVVYAIDSAGQVKIMVAAWNNDLDYIVQDGDTWELTDLGSGVNDDSDFSLALDSAGLPHLTFGIIYEDIFQLYLALTLPDLAAQWQSVVAHVYPLKTVITGKLLAHNIGTLPASGCTVKYYLSTDQQLDPSDKLLGSAKLALSAGQHQVLTFSFAHSGAVSGEYLIAALSPNNSPDVLNPNNNVAAILIP
jgi:hypothetical protein